MSSGDGRYNHVPEHHASRLLHHLNKLRTSGTFCDVQICVGKEVYSADRNVLSAASPYFEAMFTGGMAEMGQNKVEIHGLTPQIFNILLNFIYSGLSVVLFCI